MALPATQKKASKFRVEKAATPQGTKRNAEEITKGSAPEIPKASKVTFTDGPRPLSTPRRLPASAPVKVCLFKITDRRKQNLHVLSSFILFCDFHRVCFHYKDDVGDVWDAFQDKGVALFQVQLDHQAQRSVTFQMRDAMNDFLRSLHKEDEAMPGTVQDCSRRKKS